jgi:hypothetical protein
MLILRAWGLFLCLSRERRSPERQPFPRLRSSFLTRFLLTSRLIIWYNRLILLSAPLLLSAVSPLKFLRQEERGRVLFLGTQFIDAPSLEVWQDDSPNPAILPGTTLSTKIELSYSKQTTGLHSTRYRFASIFSDDPTTIVILRESAAADERRIPLDGPSNQFLIDARAIRNASNSLKIHGGDPF